MDADFLRGIVFTQAAFVFVMTIAIVIRYAMKLSLTKKQDQARPWHVLLIGLSYLWATVFICAEIKVHWGQEMTWRIGNGAGIFILGDLALMFMLSHLFMNRDMKHAIIDRAVELLAEEKRELAAELKKQTSGLAQMIKSAGEKADTAYHEANNVNQKILGVNKSVKEKLQAIKVNAEIARVKAAEAVEKASEAVTKAENIGETGQDTNTRVRRIEGNVPKTTKGKL